MIRILHIEDDKNDAELIASFMAGEGLSFETIRVDSLERFLSALEECQYDIILADFCLPSFDGLSALKISKERCPHIPFIFVSGAVGEELTVDMLRMGATDCVIKDRLSRLVPAVKRALGEAEERARSKRLQEQLIHAQRMEAVGQFAAGIAHDFNNILTIVKGFAKVLEEDIGDDDESKKNVGRIISAADKGAGLIQDLLTFCSRRKIELVEEDLNLIVKRSQGLLSKALRNDIMVRVNLAQEPLTVIADATQIEHALINLATNARDAMPEGGVLTIETGRAKLDEDFIRPYGYGNPGLYAFIVVADTGRGMDEETKKSIFEPFFTTKDIGKGTGLGLSIVYGIVRQHKGYVNVFSEVGKGATFNIYLPLAVEAG